MRCPRTIRSLIKSPAWWLFAFAFAPASAFAIDMDFYTFNAFDEVVAAFQRVALILQDPAFLVFAGIFAVLGVVFGGAMTAIRGISGQQVNPIAFLVPVLIGVALFRALVWPSGTLYVYDPVRNATQAVPDVPDIVVGLAGILNKIERGVIEIVDTASADPYAQNTGAVQYSLILNAINAHTRNVSLERNIVNYYVDCGIPSMSLGFNGASTGELKRNTADLYDTFARFNHPSLSTYYYTGAGDATATTSCANLWSILSPQLNNATTFTDMMDVICMKGGFAPSDPLQMARCDQELTSLGALYGTAPASSLPFLRSIQLANGISQALRTQDFTAEQSALVDRQVMAEGFGAAQAMDRWVPKLRGFMTATVLGLVPLTLLFVVTPLIWKALGLVAGLFLWLAMWGIADAISVQMAADAAADAFEQLRQYGMSYDAILMSPEASVQALGIFGKARSMGLMLSTVVSYGLFRLVGGYSLTSYAQSWQQHLDQAGEAAGRTALLPEERAAMMSRVVGAAAPLAAVETAGFQRAAVAAAGGTFQELGRAAPYIDSRLWGHGAGVTPSGAGAGPGSGGTATQGTSTEAGQSSASVRLADVSSSSPSHREGSMPPRGDGVLGVFEQRGQSQGGEDLGRLRAQQDTADERRRGLSEMTSERAEFEERGGLGASFGERDTLKDLGITPAEAGHLRGGMRAGETVSYMEVYRNLAGTDTVTTGGLHQMARQLNGAAIAISQAGGPADYIRALRVAQERTNEYARVIDQKDKAEYIGRANAWQEMVSTEGFQTALRAAGYQNMTQGATFSSLEGAARGRAAGEYGEMWGSAKNLADTSFARQIAGAQVTRDVASVMGMDAATVAGLVDASTYREGAHIGIAVSPENKEQIIQRLQEDGLIDARAAKYLSDREGGFDVSFAMADGRIVSGVVTAGSRTMLINETQLRRGVSEEVFDTESRSFSISTRGGYGLVDRPELMAAELSRVFDGDIVAGQRDEMRFNALASAVGQRLVDRGVQLTAADGETVTYDVSGGARVFGIGAVAGRHETDGRDSRLDLAVEYGREIIESTRTAAIKDYEAINGVGSASQEAAREPLLADWASDIRDKMQSLEKQALEQTSAPKGGHDVDPYPEKRLPTPPADQRWRGSPK